jgi:nucleoside-diphosphate-sugar epimerase
MFGTGEHSKISFMNILIIGGTGFISSRIADKLLQKGHKLTLLNRGNTVSNLPFNSNLSFVQGDRNDKRILNDLASKNRFDVVYDMIPYTEYDSKTAADCFKNKIGRFIHCSTISVYMLQEQLTIPITEEQINRALTKEFKRSPFGWDYGVNKIKCEEIIFENHHDTNFPVSVLRPTFVSGPKDPARRDWFWIERILDGNPLLVPGDGNTKFQQVYIEDTADAFCKVIETEKSIGEAYNVAGEEVFTLNEYLSRLMKLLNKTVELFHVDLKDFDKLEISYSREGDVFTFNTRRDAVFSLKKIKEDLGYKGTPFDQYMNATINWFVNNHKAGSAGYSRRDEEIKIIKSARINAQGS